MTFHHEKKVASLACNSFSQCPCQDDHCTSVYIIPISSYRTPKRQNSQGSRIHKINPFCSIVKEILKCNWPYYYYLSPEHMTMMNTTIIVFSCEHRTVKLNRTTSTAACHCFGLGSGPSSLLTVDSAPSSNVQMSTQ